jgi:hypothetical protein
VQQGALLSAQPSVHPSVEPGAHPSAQQGAQLSVQLSVHPNAQLSMQPSVHVSTHPSAQRSVQPSVQLSTHPSGLSSSQRKQPHKETQQNPYRHLSGSSTDSGRYLQITRMKRNKHKTMIRQCILGGQKQIGHRNQIGADQ